MRYSQDLKQRVLNFISEGGSKAEASRRYKISLGCIFFWLKQPPGYEARKPGPKTSRKFSRADLQEALNAKPDMLQKELAKKFHVSINAISNALRRMGIVRKKRPSATRKA